MAALVSAWGCNERINMVDQPKVEPLEASDFFDDGTSARHLVRGTVPRSASLLGAEEQRPARSMQLLQRGRQRYEIFCSVCHGMSGHGNGIVVLRGFPQPPAFHTPRLRSLPDRHLFSVLTDGLGKMPPYGKRIPIPDRWAIVDYVRALQRSQHGTLADVPPEVQQQLLRQGQSGSGGN